MLNAGSIHYDVRKFFRSRQKNRPIIEWISGTECDFDSAPTSRLNCEISAGHFFTSSMVATE
jgi:hypothetical protein